MKRYNNKLSFYEFNLSFSLAFFLSLLSWYLYVGLAYFIIFAATAYLSGLMVFFRGGFD